MSDRSARRQLLLARIAADRVELRHAAAELGRSADAAPWLRMAARGSTWLARFRGRGSGGGGAEPGEVASLLVGAWRGWRRIAPVAGVVGGVLAPVWRRLGWRGSLLLGALAATGGWLWRNRR